MSGKDYYKILELEKGASKEDIKKSFRRLAHKYHPDKGGDEAKFKELSEAYSILSDDKKRAEYDTYGQTFGGGAPGGFGQGGFGFGDGEGGIEFDLGDIFGAFTGGRGRRVSRGSDISVDITLSFEEAAFGVDRKLIITKQGTCKECKGSGARKDTTYITCDKCNGKGKIHDVKKSILGSFATVRDCDKCIGKGEMPKETCKNCKGSGVLRAPEEITVKIPSGIENGEMIRLSGYGEAITSGIAGDLYVRVHVTPHKELKKEGINLRMDLNIKLTDALLGAEHTINSLEGELKVKVPAGVSSGEILRLKGKGISSHNQGKGDLLVRIVIKTPEKLSRKAKKLIEDLKNEGV